MPPHPTPSKNCARYFTCTVEMATLWSAMGWYPGITKTFLRPLLFHHRALAWCWFRREKGSWRHHRFARALARCHCKQWVPGRLFGLGVRSFRLKILQQNLIFLWIVKNNGVLIIKYLCFVNCKYIFKIKIKLRKNNSFNWFTPFHVLIRPGVLWKKLSRPLYLVHFTVIHTISRH